MKKILLAACLFILTLFTSPIITRASDTSTLYGFTYATDGYIALGDGWTDYLEMYVVDVNNYNLGTVTTVIGRYQADPALLEIDNDVYVTMVRVTMTPTSHPSVNIYGFSDDLIVESDIDAYMNQTENNLMYYSPTTTASSTTYNVGYSLGTNTSISALGTFRSGDLYVHNQSNSPEKHYGTYFNYDIPYGAWCTKTYFREETYQYSLFIVETPENQSFRNSLTIYARFNMGSNTKYFTGLNSLNYANEWAYYYY